MKSISILLFITSFASSPLAQKQNLPQVDTTSGWQLAFSNLKLTFIYMQYVGDDPENTSCYAAAGDKKNLFLFRSRNNGVTWDSIGITPSPGPLLPTYFFTTTLIGYCNSGTPDSSIIWKTTDGGISWIPKARNANAAGPLVFANRDTGFAMGTTEIARTTDGGETWSKVIPKDGITRNAASFGNQMVGYSVANAYYDISHMKASGYVDRTVDAGLTWNPLYNGIAVDILCCQAFGNNTLYIAGSGNPIPGSYIAKTTDAGVTWDSLHYTDNNLYFPSMSFADSLHGIIAGGKSLTEGLILATTDAGKLWQKQYLSANTPPLYGVAMISDSVAIVYGHGNIYRTSVGGNFSLVKQNPVTSLEVHIIPEPFTTKTTLSYSIPKAARVDLKLYDVLGKEVYHITSDGIQSEGEHSIEIHGENLPGGVYYFILKAGSFSGMGKVTKISP